MNSRKRKLQKRPHQNECHNTQPCALPAQVDVCVIGGGASGICAAICAAEAGASVCVIEKESTCGKSILKTGNGACNFCTTQLNCNAYNAPQFVRDAFAGLCAVLPDDVQLADVLSWQSPTDTSTAAADSPAASAADSTASTRVLAHILHFFARAGLVWNVKETRMYPLSNKASTIQDVLLARLHATRAHVCAAREVVALEALDEPSAADTVGTTDVAADSAAGYSWRVETKATPAATTAHKGSTDAQLDAPQSSVVRAKTVVIATGGVSTLGFVPRELACAPFVGKLCPLTCEKSTLFALDGTRFKATISLMRGGTQVFCEDGEILIRSWGLSGIVVFNASRVARAGDVLMCNILPSFTHDALAQLIYTRLQPFDGAALSTSDARLRTTIEQCLLGLLDKSAARVIAEHFMDNMHNAQPHQAVAGAHTQQTSDAQKRAYAQQLAQCLQEITLVVTGTTHTNTAQVHQGGIALSEIVPRTLESTTYHGMFACGEALDIDGACGGYNLSWAWASGMLAGIQSARCAGAMVHATR